MVAELTVAYAILTGLGVINVAVYGPVGASGAVVEITQPYKVNGKIVGRTMLDPDLADQQCPKGYEMKRQETQTDGANVSLVSTLRCF
jgi:hypothetical protein